MSLFNVFKISSQGMTAQRERLETASANLANANTTRTASGGPYRRRDVLFETAPIEDPVETFASAFDNNFSRDLPEGVQVSTQVAGAEEVVKRYQPGHPDADANGYVSLPDVDPLEETVNIMSAARAFEANATAFNTAKEMARASLRLGEGG
jgi:flagellar basal-body rod protein FlgC